MTADAKTPSERLMARTITTLRALRGLRRSADAEVSPEERYYVLEAIRREVSALEHAYNTPKPEAFAFPTNGSTGLAQESGSLGKAFPGGGYPVNRPW